jgi:[protein-PII] uridylyltransferase
MSTVANQRAIIDRRAIDDRIAQLATEQGDKARGQVVTLLRDALAAGRAEIAKRLVANPAAGHDCAAAQSFLIDQIVRLIHDYVVRFQYPVANHSMGEHFCIAAVGGYGRGEMAPHSDVDIAFLTPMKKNSWTEQAIEAMLYILWDLGLKIGHSSRSIDEMARQAKSDLTIRTALLEGRYVWGDQDIYREASVRFWKDVVTGTARDFVSQKLEERDARHKKMGDSRYVVEPNVKDGKGGLRDLHTLYWIGKYIHQVRSAAELVDAGLLTMTEFRGFRRSANFLWAVRCHLHDITGRAEDRLTFDLQREVATRMRFADRPGKSAVERFMQYFFLNAKRVGDLTGVFLAQLDDQFAARDRRFIPAILRRRPRKLSGFILDRGRLALPRPDFFREDPVRMIEIFQLADKHKARDPPQRDAPGEPGCSPDRQACSRRSARQCAVHGCAVQSARSRTGAALDERGDGVRPLRSRFRPCRRADAVRHVPPLYRRRAHDPRDRAARPDRIGRTQGRSPARFDVMSKQIISRRVLYVAVLLHDIAKGRGGDHSVLGADVAMKLCPRLGLTEAETEQVAWLVRYHLLMSATAFKRDLTDYKTIADFAAMVQSPERLKLLLVLTVVDIRAVGPGIWNSWKRQLLGNLFESTEEVLRLGHKQHGRRERVLAKQDAVRAMVAIDEGRFVQIARKLDDAYWIAEPEDIIAQNVRLIDAHDTEPLTVAAEFYPARGATLVTVSAADHPGLFYRIAGGIHLAGGNIIDARIHTRRDGMALDNFLVQDPLCRPFMEESQIARLKTAIADALANRMALTPRLIARPTARPRSEAFNIAPVVLVDNKASNRFTVIEVNALDRPALLNRLAFALFDLKCIVHSAHVATYGERAVDTFYVTDLLGDKIDSKVRLKSLEKRLLAAGSPQTEQAVAA